MTSEPSAVEAALRAAAISWIESEASQDRRVFSDADVAAVPLLGQQLRLKDRTRGIRKPVHWSAALSIVTTYRPEGATRPYEDEVGSDGLLRYKWEGTDPNLYTNVALRMAMQQQVPLIWFVGIAAGRYTAIAPVWIVGEEPAKTQFVVAVDPAQRVASVGSIEEVLSREYAWRLTKQRVHQPVFREQVMRAYESRCTVCRLKHSRLLDAAHIIADGEPGGDPVVINGMAMCKIHHAAYDTNILGIRPDHVVEIRPDVLHEKDGPMLEYGLKDRHGQELLWLPRSRKNQPDKDRLGQRYQEFLNASS